jgi:hypothetical protein
LIRLAALAVVGWALGAHGAALYLEQYLVDAQGWSDRDASDMAFSYNGGFGNPSGSLQGNFALQGTPSVETDAFRGEPGDSGNAFFGDYWADIGYGNFYGWRFDFYADDVLPSDLTIRFGNGTYTFSQAVGSQVTALDQWFTVNVPLTYGGWFGGTSTEFSNTLQNVTFIDVQITRNGAPDQTYYMDNFELHNEVPPVSVPEPTTGLFVLGSVLLYGLRRNRRKKEAAGG